MTSYTGASVFDGTSLSDGPLHVDGQTISDGASGQVVQLQGGYLLPGLLDLQVNGSGGHLVSGQSTASDLALICTVQAKLGATGVLPTLITDTPEATASVIKAGIEATQAAVPGFLGLHLEGPHLDPRRKGAHDANLIRPMTDADLNRLCEGRKGLPALMVTLAPESATPAQIAELAAAGVVVSLGHSDCTLSAARAGFAAGATCVTHLFNAMSQLGHREPGLVGAALTDTAWCGLIADGHHVSTEAMQIAVAARPEGLFLVSDCMSPAGTDAREFSLGGRRILRQDGRLTLEDGTLAGADLTLPQAMKIMVRRVGVSHETAFAMASSRPAAVLGRSDLGHLRPGAAADFIHLDEDFTLQSVWRAGRQIF
ncbi:N-acetylglucosamine-6-phosphate deacetylase [Xinfangfangia sp. CPCC 101601]|uniref:N-acetylglucosamine-6-phosphate deacetylase n=1 Tax=Pseudogemmobacter lacusdianii TaxID=3069608 RepID=A0ABU0VU63_9RHOB|nr:N-acetylglucosamine-6-phosphate deacetylase [Xinfangfangia sp. CPCC 101601]MDQ2065270.1 N-acetylglucosamine-6-phosphate deacetylase [Xinfangfangia sp. CPCC 101601]